MDLRFVSSNPHKIREVESILSPAGIRTIPWSAKIEEIQTEDVHRLVRDKLLKAFQKIGKPVFIEHTGIHLPGLNNLPGGLTQIFWDRLEADKFTSIVAGIGDNRIIAKTTIGYCDSKTIHFFEGEISGTVPATPVGDRTFQWDCVFVPDGHSHTFAELGDKKNDISMRKIALDKLVKHLTK